MCFHLIYTCLFVVVVFGGGDPSSKRDKLVIFIFFIYGYFLRLTFKMLFTMILDKSHDI